MGKFKGIRPNVIKGPIGQGAPFKMHYNTDGSPNYVLAVNKQKELAKQSISKGTVKNLPTVQDRGKGYVSDYVKQLRSSVANVQKAFQQQNKELPKQFPNNSKAIIKEVEKTLIQKAPVKQPIKNAPAIKR